MNGEGPARERPPRTQEREPRPDSHKEKGGGKIDLSRGLLTAGDIRVGAGDGPDALPGRDFVDSGGWPHGAGAGGIFHDTVSCSTAGPDHNEGRDKTPPGTKESDTHVDERRGNKQPAPVRRGSTGQPAPIMEG